VVNKRIYKLIVTNFLSLLNSGINV